MKINITVIALCFLLVSCTASSPIEEPTSSDAGVGQGTNTLTATSTEEAAVPPTENIVPTETPAPTLTPTPTMIPVPAGAEPLTLENVAQAEVLAWPVKGEILDAYYLPDGEHYAVITENGTDSYALDGTHLARVDINTTFSTLSFDGRYLAVIDPYTNNICRV
jgi:hypothetical protein